MPKDIKAQPVPRRPLNVAQASYPASVKTEGGKPEYKPNPTRYGDWEKSGRCIDF